MESQQWVLEWLQASFILNLRAASQFQLSWIGSCLYGARKLSVNSEPLAVTRNGSHLVLHQAPVSRVLAKPRALGFGVLLCAHIYLFETIYFV